MLLLRMAKIYFPFKRRKQPTETWYGRCKALHRTG